MDTWSDLIFSIAVSAYRDVYSVLWSAEDSWHALAVSSGFKSLVLLAAAGLVSCFIRNAATRHLVWALGVFSLLILPLFTLGLPTLSLPMPPLERGVITHEDVAIRLTDQDFQGALMASSAPIPIVDPPRIARSVTQLRSRSPTSSTSRAEDGQVSWPSILAMVWAVGLIALAISFLLDLSRRHRLTADARNVQDPAWKSMVEELSDSLGIRRRPRLQMGTDVPVPITWGILRSTISLPDDAISWPLERRRDVLLHELAHIQRRDMLTQTVAQVARAVYWFNPLVWWAEHRLRIESEHACDDLVLRHGSRPSSYADHLLAAARSLRGRVPATTQAMARGSKLGDRVRAILDPSRARSPLTVWRLLTTSSLAILLALPLAAAGPGLPAVPTPPAAPEPPEAPEAPVAPVPPVAPTTPPSPPESPAALEPPLPPGTLEAPIHALHGFSIATVTDVLPSHAERCGVGSSVHFAKRRNGSYHMNVQIGPCHFKYTLRGAIEFSVDEDRVVGLEPGAYLEIDENIGDDRRRIEISRGDGGQPEVIWFVDGEEQTFDDDARAWLAEALPLLFRTTGLDASARVGRLLERGGVNEVLTEVTLLLGDHVQRIYLVELLEQAQLGAEDLARTLRLGGREIGSDHELAEFLTSLSGHDLEARETNLAFAEATQTIGSDFELRRVLAKLLARELSHDVLDIILESAQTIGSDFELAELLIELTTQGLEPGASFFAALETIGSDFELRRVLATTVDQIDLTPELMTSMLESSRTIGSDHELSELLIQLARAHPIDDDLRDHFMQLLESVGSTHQRDRVLAVLNG